MAEERTTSSVSAATFVSARTSNPSASTLPRCLPCRWRTPASALVRAASSQVNRGHSALSWIHALFTANHAVINGCNHRTRPLGGVRWAKRHDELPAWIVAFHTIAT